MSPNHPQTGNLTPKDGSAKIEMEQTKCPICHKTFVRVQMGEDYEDCCDCDLNHGIDGE